MPIAAFICPMVGTGTRADPRRAKYQRGAPADGIVRSGQIRFGHADDAILVIEAPQAYLDTIAADPECRLIADASTINNPLTAPQVNAIQTFLENRGVPADWLAPGETRRQALRGLAGMFLFSQRMEGRYGASWKQKLVQHGVNLSTPWQALPVVLQNELVETATSFGWTGVVPQPATTLRAILRAMGNRFQGQRVFIAGFEL